MKETVDLFCNAIDRAYPNDPEKKERSIKIFARVVEDMFGVVLIGRSGLRAIANQREATR